MKKCPFCAEDIQDEAIKCRYCSEFLDSERQPKVDFLPVYYKPGFITIVFCIVGPFALPLVLLHPTLSKTWKAVVSILVLGGTWFLYNASMQLMDALDQLM